MAIVEEPSLPFVAGAGAAQKMGQKPGAKSKLKSSPGFERFRDELELASPLEKIRRVRHGFKASDCLAAIEHFGITQKFLCDITGMSLPTLDRRLKDDGLLKPSESERLARIAHLETAAIRTFGSADSAKNWLLARNRVLGCAPLELVDTDIGSDEVLKILNAIEYGGVV